MTLDVVQAHALFIDSLTSSEGSSFILTFPAWNFPGILSHFATELHFAEAMDVLEFAIYLQNPVVCTLPICLLHEPPPLNLATGLVKELLDKLLLNCNHWLRAGGQ